MDFIEEYQPIDLDLQNQIKEHLLNDNRKFNDSMVYKSDTKEKLILKDSRTSEFKIFKDKKIFNLCDQLINKINQNNQYHDYILFKNDVTFIKYHEGGFFNKHEDYLSLVSNSIEEYTLIMSMNESTDICVGGNTILYPNDNFKYSSNASVLPNNVLIFRKDIKHEGEIISKGTKKIMTLNLWKINKNNQIVVINFKNDNKTHIIPFNNLLSRNIDNKLKKYVSGLSKNKEKLSNVIYFNEDKFTYEQFNIIVRLYSNCTINYEEYEANKNIITNYGFGWNNLIVVKKDPIVIVKEESSSVDESTSEEEIDSDEELTETFVRESGVVPSKVINSEIKNQWSAFAKYDAYDKKINDIEKKIILAETPFTNNVHIFNTEARYIQFIEIIKKYKLNYMPFKFLFAEGSVSYDGDYAYSVGEPHQSIDLPMTPLWSSFSERENLYHFNNIVHLGLHETFENLSEILSEPLAVPNTSEQFKKLPNCGEAAMFCDYDPILIQTMLEHKTEVNEDNEDNDYCDLRGISCANINLTCALDYNSLSSKIETIFDDNRNVTMPTLGKCGTLDEDHIYYRGEYYSISRNNIMTLEPAHFDKVRKKIVSINPFKEALDKINSTKFTFPQISGNAEKHFCNESVYGSLSVLQVCGVMKMD